MLQLSHLENPLIDELTDSISKKPTELDLYAYEIENSSSFAFDTITRLDIRDWLLIKTQTATIARLGWKIPQGFNGDKIVVSFNYTKNSGAGALKVVLRTNVDGSSRSNTVTMSDPNVSGVKTATLNATGQFDYLNLESSSFSNPHNFNISDLTILKGE